MSGISTAIGSERLARVDGYKIKKGFFDNSTANLPQIIAVLGEANTANQGDLSVIKREITSALEAAELYGYGSPIHQQMRILRPVNSEGVGGIPTIVFPQISDAGATPTVQVWTITGTATRNATHFGVIAGRRDVDFESYSYSIAKGDTPTIIAQKISDAINGVLSSPVTASAALGVVTITTKWSGETSAALNVRFDNRSNDAGISYTQTTETPGAGAVDLADSLVQFGSDWYTIVLNPYAENDIILLALEQYNGFPDDENPTGNYVGRKFTPFVSLFGSTLADKDDLVLVTDAVDRVAQNTNVLCPAPNSEGFPAEASANACTILARIAQDNPELDTSDKSYFDMPVPENGIIGDMSNYDNRDFLVKKGCSTVVLENGKYNMQDLVTTYHPEGEKPLQYSYVRNLIIDWNIKDGYQILERRNVLDHVLVQDGQVTDAAKSVKPKQWKGVLFDYLDSLAVKALINDPQFSKDSLRVEVDGDNPNRFNCTFRYRRTGVARIVSTDVEAGF